MNSAVPFSLIALCGLILWRTVVAFQNPLVMDAWIFSSFRIRTLGEYYRLISSAFIHADWAHFTFNVVGLVIWGEVLEYAGGWWFLPLVFLLSALGGSLLSLFIHRHESDYQALGASGGVLGVIFASLQVYGGSVQPLFLPGIGIPAPVFAIAYLVVSYLALKRRLDNVGHSAHIGGAVTGFLTVAVIFPEAVSRNPEFFWAMTALGALAAFGWFFREQISELKAAVRRDRPEPSERFQRYDQAVEKADLKKELDDLLDKVSRSGMDSLSGAEKRRLSELSRKL